MLDKKRFVEQNLELDAPLEVVWKAITDAEELTNWFPMKVEKNNEGGVKLIWDDTAYFDLQLNKFELHKYLNLIEKPRDAHGRLHCRCFQWS